MSFGENVLAYADILANQGLDPNKISEELVKRFQLRDYGIGTLSDRCGNFLKPSSVFHNMIAKIHEETVEARYINSAPLMPEFEEAILTWQGIPRKYWGNCIVACPSDAGTGTVSTSLNLALRLFPEINCLSVEELGWAVYQIMAKNRNLRFSEFDVCGLPSKSSKALPLYQVGPHNGTGLLRSRDVWVERAKQSAKLGVLTVLDRAYSAYTYAHLALSGKSLDYIMHKEYVEMLEPFFENGVFFCMGISPTKSLLTFDKRPAGIMVVYYPDKSKIPVLKRVVLELVRDRGSSFEHEATRAMIKLFAKSYKRLSGDMYKYLKMVGRANNDWAKYTKGTALESYFDSSKYGGIFRNCKIREGGQADIYEERLCPSFGKGLNCRFNLFGLPKDVTAKNDIRDFERAMV